MSVNSAGAIERLAVYHRSAERIRSRWGEFLAKRSEQLAPHPFAAAPVEKVTENILCDLFVTVLDWPSSCFVPQVGHADIVLSNLGVRWIIVEAKRPGALAWNRRAVERALDQAAGYAGEQQVRCVAVSDGVMLYAADLVHGGRRDRVFVSLAQAEPPTDLWWLSVQGIYRPRSHEAGAALRLLPDEPVAAAVQGAATSEGETVLHPKYKLPAHCFAYVGDPSNPRTWKLPYLCAEGTIDAKRLPKAIQCILTNYRGGRVSGIPEVAIAAVLERLARAAHQAGHLPAANPAPVYVQLGEALKQFGIVIET
jgi:hypothetical protein